MVKPIYIFFFLSLSFFLIPQESKSCGNRHSIKVSTEIIKNNLCKPNGNASCTQHTSKEKNSDDCGDQCNHNCKCHCPSVSVFTFINKFSQPFNHGELKTFLGFYTSHLSAGFHSIWQPPKIV